MVCYRSYVRERKDDLVERNFFFAQFSENKDVAMKEYERFVKGRMGQGHREDFYEEVVQRQILRPLQMESTGVRVSTSMLRRLATGHNI